MKKITESKTDIPIRSRIRIGVQTTGVPDEHPVLALIESQTDLGRSRWREVVFHDGEQWCSFAGSDTFDDGEKVVKWVYASECI